MKILIVDDEHFARIALEKLVRDYFEQQGLPLFCYSFEDSQLAYEYLNVNEVDLLMTDIKMSGIDGLKLAEVVQNMNMETVIISGYADFTYAQIALKYDVSDYLLKPISRKKIYDCLEEQVRYYHQKCETNKRIEETKKHMFYQQIATNPDFVSQSLLEVLGEGTDFQATIMAMFYSTAPFLPVEEVLFEESVKIKDMVGVVVDNTSHTIFLLIYFTKCNNLEVVRDRIVKQCNYCYKNMEKDIKEREISVSVSAAESSTSLYKLFRQCSYALNEKILNPGQHLFDYQELIDKKCSVSVFDSSLEYELKQSFEFKDEAFSKSIIEHQIQSMIERKYVSLWNLTDFISRMTVVINKVIYEYNREYQNQLEYIPETFLTQFRTIEEIKEYFCNYISMIYKEGELNSVVENVVDKLNKYVEENYFLPISLSEIAKNVYYLNPSYLSRLFKSQKGVSFSKFLMDYRMEKAMEYFRNNSEISVQEVASLTGFSNGSYFVKQFKKKYGETPGYYQKRQRN